jgi:hypothetical protein
MDAVAPGLRHGFGRAERPQNGRRRRRRAADLEPTVARTAVLAALFALLVHTLTYAAFLSDPLTWLLLALGGGLAAAQLRRSPARSASSRTPSPRRGSRAWRAWLRNSRGLRPGRAKAASARAK